MKKRLLLLLFLAPLKCFPISFGPVELGSSKMRLNLKDFTVIHKMKVGKVEAAFIKNSVQWIRGFNNLLTPRARVGIKIYKNNTHIKYENKVIIPTIHKKKYFYTEIYVNLFNPENITIHRGKILIDTIIIQAKKRDKNFESALIDHSCLRYNFKVIGLENEYLSVGCRLDRIGPWGEERPRLQVTWSTTNFRLEDNSSPPYISFLHDNSPAIITLIDANGSKRKVKLKAQLPKRLKRLKTAIGLGPYELRSKQETSTRKPTVSAAFMFYAKYDIAPTASIRAFDAVVYKDTLFNNAGLYFAYEVATVLDKQISIVPLLGVQGLSFRYNSKSKTYNSVIYPQGFEIDYIHAFGKKNYRLVYGMFISTSSDVIYDNLWVRYGKKLFYEINFIRWGQKEKTARMWGLSIGFPFASFF